MRTDPNQVEGYPGDRFEMIAGAIARALASLPQGPRFSSILLRRVIVLLEHEQGPDHWGSEDGPRSERPHKVHVRTRHTRRN